MFLAYYITVLIMVTVFSTFRVPYVALYNNSANSIVIKKYSQYQVTLSLIVTYVASYTEHHALWLF